MLARKIINLEVVGGCNLRCPSCPVGNYGDRRSLGGAKGVIAIPLYRDIVAKLREEVGTSDAALALYSWGEPLLHPHIGELVAIGKSAGFKVNLSTNLNYVRNLESVVASGVDEIVVSVSGFTNRAYQATHRGGDIEQVKGNMRYLAQLIDSAPVKPAVWVNYHLYRHNVGDDIVRMTALCRELGFSMLYNIALYLPADKMIAISNGDHAALPEAALAEKYLVPISRQLAISAARTPTRSCELRDSRLDIDVDGSVRLCSPVFERRWDPSCHYLTESLAAIQEKRRASALCHSCMGRGINQIYTLAVLPEWQHHANGIFRGLGSRLEFRNGELGMRGPERMASAASR